MKTRSSSRLEAMMNISRSSTDNKDICSTDDVPALPKVEIAEASSTTEIPSATKAVSSAVTPSKTKAVSTAKIPSKTEAVSSAATPSKTKSVSTAKIPSETEAVSTTEISSKTEAVAVSIETVSAIKEAISAINETNDLIERSSTLRVDDEFDIDEFGNEEVQNKNLEPSVLQPNLSEEDFLKKFPEINVSENAKPKKVRDKIKTIAEYAIDTCSSPNKNSPAALNAQQTPFKSRPDASKSFNSPHRRPTVSNVQQTPLRSNNICNSSPSTSKGVKHKNHPTKRPYNGILVFDNNSNDENASKRFRPDESLDKNLAPCNIMQTCDSSIFGQNDTDTDNDSDDDDDSDQNNEPNEVVDQLMNSFMSIDMPFPNLGEDINFDVRALNQRSGINVTIGEKRMADYLREKILTSDCIDHLYNSIMNAPLDAVDRDPKGLNVQLMPHQRQALTWMKWREQQKPSGGILADDMGLGKTIQLLALVLANKNEQKEKDRAEGKEESDDDYDDDWGFTNTREIFPGKTLVICPPSLLNQWEREVLTKCKRGTLSVFIYHGDNRQISEKRLSSFDVVITTYNLITIEQELSVAPKESKDSRIFRIHWERVILDEAHFIRNHKSKASNAICELRATKKWALTGTPIQNKESDLFALIKFVGLTPFDEWSVWHRWVSNRNSCGNKRLVVISKALMLRRTKAELIEKGVIQSLPEKKFDVITVKLDDQENIVYQKLLLYSQTFFHEFLRQKREKENVKLFGCYDRNSLICQEVPKKLSKLMKLLIRNHTQVGGHFVLVLILRLRQMCCHPALIKAMLDKENIENEGYEEQAQSLNTDLMTELNKLMTDDEDSEDDDDGYLEALKIDAKVARNVMSSLNPVFRNDRKSSKVKAVLNTIEGILEMGEKVVVVSQWTGFLDVIAFHLQFMRGAKFNTFSGKTSIKDRQRMIDRINDYDDQLNILLLSLTAGGLGLNLVGANHLLILDLHWNPQLETQAQDRIYRFGQENNVRIYKFVCQDTIEEKIQILQEKKLQIAKKVLTGSVSNRLTLDDLKLLFS